MREIEPRKMVWLRHLERTREHRLIEKITEWKHIAFRRKERPEVKWENDVKQDIKVMKIYLWKKKKPKICKNLNGLLGSPKLAKSCSAELRRQVLSLFPG